MLSNMLLHINIIVLSLVSYTEQLCNEAATPLDGIERRSVNYTSTPMYINEFALREGWYSTMYNGSQYLIADSIHRPADIYFKCGSTFPFYLNGLHPSLKTITEEPIAVDACFFYPLTCTKVKIRKCNGQIQYYLLPINTWTHGNYSAYCFDRCSEILEGDAFDCQTTTAPTTTTTTLTTKSSLSTTVTPTKTKTTTALTTPATLTTLVSKATTASLPTMSTTSTTNQTATAKYPTTNTSPISITPPPQTTTQTKFIPTSTTFRMTISNSKITKLSSTTTKAPPSATAVLSLSTTTFSSTKSSIISTKTPTSTTVKMLTSNSTTTTPPKTTTLTTTTTSASNTASAIIPTTTTSTYKTSQTTIKIPLTATTSTTTSGTTMTTTTFAKSMTTSPQTTTTTILTTTPTHFSTKSSLNTLFTTTLTKTTITTTNPTISSPRLVNSTSTKAISNSTIALASSSTTTTSLKITANPQVTTNLNQTIFMSPTTPTTFVKGPTTILITPMKITSETTKTTTTTFQTISTLTSTTSKSSIPSLTLKTTTTAPLPSSKTSTQTKYMSSSISFNSIKSTSKSFSTIIPTTSSISMPTTKISPTTTTTSSLTTSFTTKWTTSEKRSTMITRFPTITTTTTTTSTKATSQANSTNTLTRTTSLTSTPMIKTSPSTTITLVTSMATKIYPTNSTISLPTTTPTTKTSSATTTTKFALSTSTGKISQTTTITPSFSAATNSSITLKTYSPTTISSPAITKYQSTSTITNPAKQTTSQGTVRMTPISPTTATTHSATLFATSSATIPGTTSTLTLSPTSITTSIISTKVTSQAILTKMPTSTSILTTKSFPTTTTKPLTTSFTTPLTTTLGTSTTVKNFPTTTTTAIAMKAQTISPTIKSTSTFTPTMKTFPTTTTTPLNTTITQISKTISTIISPITTSPTSKISPATTTTISTSTTTQTTTQSGTTSTITKSPSTTTSTTSIKTTSKTSATTVTTSKTTTPTTTAPKTTPTTPTLSTTTEKVVVVGITTDLQFKKDVIPNQHEVITPYIVFRCGFLKAHGRKYSVSWFFNGNILYQTCPSTNETDFLLHEDELLAYAAGSSLHAQELTCSVSIHSHFIASLIISTTYSASLKIAAEVKTNPVVLFKNGISTIDIEFTLPIGCGYSIINNEKPAFPCDYSLQLYMKNGSSCEKGGIANMVNYPCSHDFCTQPIKMLERSCEWNSTKFTHSLTIATIDRNYNDGQTYVLELKFDDSIAHKLWRNYTFPDIQVIINDSELYKNKVCYSRVDPHMQTSDQRTYEHQSTGYFMLYYNSQYKIEVQEQVEKCSVEDGTCVCGIAVRAGKDVFVINTCGSVNYLGFTSCGEGGIIDVQSVYTNQYEIYTPIGTRIIVTMFDKERRLNVHIFMAPKDEHNVKGLCGKFDGNKSNDFTYNVGGPIKHTLSYDQDPEMFSESWRLVEEENLFLSPPRRELESWENINKKYCICKRPGESFIGTTCSSSQYIGCRKAKSLTQEKCGSFSRKRRSSSERAEIELRRVMALFSQERSERKKRQVSYNISADEAARMCAVLKQSLPLTELAEVSGNESVEVAMFQCEYDVVHMNDPSLVNVHLDVRNDIAKTMLSLSPSYVANNTEKVNNFIANSCTMNCSGNGLCLADGTCSCTGTFRGSDCSIDITQPLEIDDIEGGGICDIAEGDDCKCFTVRTNDLLDNFHCVIDVYQVSNNSTVKKIWSESNVGMYEDLFTGVCCVNNEQQTLRTERYALKYAVAISNDGVNYGAAKMTFIYDSTCETVDSSSSGDLIISMKDNFCFLDGSCVENNQTNNADRCLVCNPESDVFSWTRVCEHTDADDNAVPVIAITSTVIITLLAVVLALAIVWKFCFKKKVKPSSKTDEIPEEMLTMKTQLAVANTAWSPFKYQSKEFRQPEKNRFFLHPECHFTQQGDALKAPKSARSVSSSTSEAVNKIRIPIREMSTRTGFLNKQNLNLESKIIEDEDKTQKKEFARGLSVINLEFGV